MCSSQGICSGSSRSRSSSSGAAGSGAHYALCALGVGLIALGIVMIVWTVVPFDGESSTGNPSGNSTVPTEEDDNKDRTKSSSVAMVLVGVGGALLLLSICLGVRSKRRARNQSRQPAQTGAALTNREAGDQEEPAPTAYNVPSYEEVVGSNTYPVRQSNLRSSTSQLPSYEDIIAAVENEGSTPTATTNPTEETPLNDPTPAPAQPTQQSQDEAGVTERNPSLPARSSSRASRLLRPLRVRRIKSDKLHLKDFRLQIRSPTQNPVTIEPITPPPGYENKMPELN